jgi:hypothetical protein
MRAPGEEVGGEGGGGGCVDGRPGKAQEGMQERVGREGTRVCVCVCCFVCGGGVGCVWGGVGGWVGGGGGGWGGGGATAAPTVVGVCAHVYHNAKQLVGRVCEEGG